MKFRLFSLFLLSGLAPVRIALAAPPALVDYDFGADQAIWKPDGQALALQDAHGIAIRDGHSLKLKRYFRIERGDEEKSWPLLRAWNGDDLFLESQSRYDERGRVLPPRATVISARDGSTRAVWKNADFSADGNELWFHHGTKFRVLSLKTRRWFDAHLPMRTTDREGDAWASDITFSPDGRFAADQLKDGRMRLWNVKTRRATAILSDKVSSAAYPQVLAPVVWSPDGKLVATLGEDPSHRDIYYDEGPNDGTVNEHPPVVKIWNARSGKLVQWFASLSAPNQLWWRDNRTLWIGGKSSYSTDAAFETWRVGAKSGQKIEVESPVAPHGDRLFAGDRLLQLNGNNKPRALKVLFVAPTPLKNVAWSRDGRFVAATYLDLRPGEDDISGVQIWNSQKFDLENTGQAHAPMRMGWTLDNRVWCSDFYQISSWSEREKWKQNDWLAPIIGKSTFPNSPPANGLFLRPDGERILQLSENFDHAIYERANRDAAPQLLWKNAQSGGFGEVLSPDGNWLSFWENNEKDSNVLELRAYEMRSGGRHLTVRHPEVKDAAGNARWELSPRFSPDSRYLSWGFQVMKWPSREVIADTRHLKGNTFALAPGAQELLRVTPDDVRLTDLRGRVKATLSRDSSQIQDAAFSFDGQRVAVARAHELEIYDVKTGRLQVTLYAWPRAKATPAADWLALRPGFLASGTPVARALVTFIGRK